MQLIALRIVETPTMFAATTLAGESLCHVADRAIRARAEIFRVSRRSAE